MLSPATTYYYRVRAVGAGGTSGNSAVISLLTPPAVPTATQATSITQTGFTANWNPVTGATSYSIDVATDAAFTSILSGYSNLAVATTSTGVTGLSSGVTYYYRVRSVNSGGNSTYSNTISLITIPADPIASSATAITTNSFTANWATSAGAASYLLDVATDNSFNSILSSYNNFLVNGTSSVISGLSSGTTYYYRVRATNSGGTSFNSATINVLTIPSAPVALAATAVNLNSFVANWSSVIGATFYTIDVATDNAFANLVYSNINVGNAFSYNAASLTTGTTYYYRVRANNSSGNSIYSNTISTTTLNVVTLQASALTFSNISSNSITANFTSGNGSSRIVVVSASALIGLPVNGITYSANANFGSGNTLGNGYVVYNGSSNNITVTNLAAATNYYFRVFEYSGTGGTENYLTTTSTNNPSNTSTVSVAPTAQPSAITFSQQTGTSVTVSFQAANPAPAGYIALRAAGSSPTTTPSSGTTYSIGAALGNATIAYVGNGTSFNETSLPTSTHYFYSIYSYNGSNSFISYLTSQPAQANVTLDVVAPVITFPSANPTSVNEGTTQTLGLNATDNFSVASVQLFHRGIAESTFTSSAATAGSGDTYSIQTQTSWYDALGMEYYFIATDENGNATTKPATSFFIKKVQPTLTYQIPASNGNGVNDYKIFSFPYSLSPSNSVDAVFPTVASTDISKFRMLWYNPTKKAYDEYAKGEFTKIDLSKGYWLLTSSATSASTTNATLPTFDRSHLDSIKLLPGWNQIGNPYPTAIKWSDVQNFIGQPAGTDTLSLYVYNSGWSKLKSIETLPAFSGGFVKNTSSTPITIYIPFLGQTAKGGRTINDDSGSDISQTSWQVDLSVLQEGNTNKIGGIGMDPKAHFGLDRFDDSNPPSFKGMPELLFEQKENSLNDLARSVVPTQSNYNWKFLVSGEVGKTTELNWNADLGQGNEQLFLLDEVTMQVVDMRAQQNYSFKLSEGQSFKIFFGKDLSITTDDVKLSQPFPNPSTEKKSNFILGLPDSNSNYSVNLQVFNSSGELIDVYSKNLLSGIHQLQWQMAESLIPGMYFYRVSVSDGKRNVSSTGKIIIQ
ncbi:MAG TPA: hypothetical protein DGG95_04785 [Cytophagales bacterium]|nr:hypothetical protein [Cytophagales bacterium]